MSFVKNKSFTQIKRQFNQFNVRSLFQEYPLRLSCLIGTGITLLYVLYLFPIRFLQGHGGFFEKGEMLVSISGWWSYSADHWRFPLFKTQLLNTPQGANIAFTNSIPIAAFLLKPLKFLLPQGFHYFGVWFLIAYVLQAVSAILLVRSLGQRTLLATLAATSMALMMPAFLWQIENAALVTQGYVLLGFMLYFSGIKNPRAFQTTVNYFTGLIAISLLTHPYLCAMVSVLYISFLGDHYLKFRNDQRKCLIALAITIGIATAILTIGGYLGQVTRANGYGYYSMNLLSPVYGGNLGYRFVNATGGQRSFNYLGMGVVASLAFTLATRWAWLIQITRRYRILSINLLLLTIFAISNRIFYGSQELFRYPLYPPFRFIAEVFRSSDRMFWPVGYVLMLIGLVGVLRFENKRWSSFVILLVLGLQFYDTQPYQKTIYRLTRQSSVVHPSWNRLIRAVSSVHVYPGYGCGGVTNTAFHRRNVLFFQGLASRHGRPINTAYLLRNKPNIASKHAAFHRPLQRGRLYIVTKESKNVPATIKHAMRQGWTRKVGGNILCVPYTDSNWWRNKIPQRTMTSRNQSSSSWLSSFF